jgi:hypothetical protein
MKQKSFLRLLLETTGSAFAGNLLALVVVISLGGLGTGNFMIGVSAFCGISLYMVMTFNSGHKDGEQERKYVRRKTIEKPNPSKWIKIGLIVWGIMCIPCVVLILIPGSLTVLTIVRFSLGSVFALSLLLGSSEIPAWSPYLFMGIYAVTPVMCRLGYYVGYYEKMTLDSIIYKKVKKK